MDDGREQPRGRAADADVVSWVDDGHVTSLRVVVGRYLDGDRRLATEVESLSAALASCARDKGYSAERLLIAIRALWRGLGLTHGDRLQVTALYDQIVRHSIEQYYDQAE